MKKTSKNSGEQLASERSQTTRACCARCMNTRRGVDESLATILCELARTQLQNHDVMAWNLSGESRPCGAGGRVRPQISQRVARLMRGELAFRQFIANHLRLPIETDFPRVGVAIQCHECPSPI